MPKQRLYLMVSCVLAKRFGTPHTTKWTIRHTTGNFRRENSSEEMRSGQEQKVNSTIGATTKQISNSSLGTPCIDTTTLKQSAYVAKEEK